ncbi:hypothetical protein FRC01_004119 [Tulasnella sp. 417]|nr:hypothetical protein FRC01_004119 [Tulasnella sp. 417]
MPATFWWDMLGPSKRDLDQGLRGAVQILVVVPGGRRVIVEPSAKTYFTTCNLWNDSLPIHRLPTEVLSDILLLAIPPSTLERDPSRHPLARVCSFWRAVILDTPMFWATISNQSSRDAVQLKIHRSRNFKLDFVYSQRANYLKPFIGGTQFMQLIGPHISRCNSFRVRVLNGDESYDWISRKSQGSYIPRLIVESADPSGQQVSKDSIPGEVQNVCLENIRIPWQPNSLPKLLSLQITGNISAPIIYSWDRRSGLRVVRDILRACPCLKVLKLDRFRDGLGSDVDLTLLNDGTISFPSLENLEMAGSPSDLLWEVLDRIEFPSLSRLCIYPTQLPWSGGRLKDAVCRRIGGRSLLQSIIDRANCDCLTVLIVKGPDAHITVRGTKESRRVIDLDPLTRYAPITAALEVLRAIKGPVNIKVSGDPGGSFIQSLKRPQITGVPIPKKAETDRWHFIPW